MQVAIKKLFLIMPLLFGIGFIAPLIDQTMRLWRWEAPWGLTPLTLGLIIGGVWGLYATIRGRWI